MKLNLRIILFLFLSFMTCLATIPYGYNFIKYHIPDHALLQIICGSIFALVAGAANLILGFYSLISIKFNNFSFVVLIFCLLNAFITAFLSYYGYQNLMPLSLNLGMSSMVFIVNAAIDYTAITTTLSGIRSFFADNYFKKVGYKEFQWRTLGFLFGLTVSSLGFLISLKGITMIFNHFQFNRLLDHHVNYIIAFFMWVSYGALFSISNQAVAGRIYTNVKKMALVPTRMNLLVIIVCIISGGALAEIARQFVTPITALNQSMHLGQVELNPAKILIVFAFLSNAALNYFAIQRVQNHYRSQRPVPIAQNA